MSGLEIASSAIRNSSWSQAEPDIYSFSGATSA